MSATEIIQAIQAYTDANGTDSARITYGPPTGDKVEIPRIGREDQGQAWEGEDSKESAQACFVGGLAAWIQASGAIEPWHEVGASGEPSFQNGWMNYDAVNWNSAGFYIDTSGVVRLKGIIAGGTLNAVAFVLPVGYRPAKRTVRSSIANGALSRVDVDTDGSVILALPNNSAWSVLDGVDFRAA